MFLIVESGSTKADWVEVEPSGETRLHKTLGINPTTQDVLLNFQQNETLASALENCNKIFFYGAGVSNDSSRDRIKNWLFQANTEAHIYVESDMLGAARACCGHEKGIVGILGTGSNSCVYDGQSITSVIPSLGYILSDEGSGVHIGKEILRAYFYKLMPVQIRTKFDEQYHLHKNELLDNVYRSAEGSKYIASFASFLIGADEDWKIFILNKVFREFVEYRILTMNYPDHYPIHFIGSIAFHHQKYLKNVMLEFGLTTGNIIEQPIHKLIEYHFKKEYK